MTHLEYDGHFQKDPLRILPLLRPRVPAPRGRIADQASTPTLLFPSDNDDETDYFEIVDLVLVI